MRAMILAAGEGTRLRPLTLTRPKPMIPVVNRPNLGHVLDKLSHAGIKEAAVNLCFHARQITSYLGKGKQWELDLRFSREKQTRGTAGSLAPLKNFFRHETFIVLSGDGVSEINLNELEAHHKRNKAAATIVLSQIDARFEYGLVKIADNQKVTALIEKPSWREAFAPYVNTGIYMFEPEILNMIPDDGTFDFARDLFPKLLARDAPVYGYPLDGYWCDIGNLKEYKRCHKDILEGRAGIKISGKEIEPNIWLGTESKIAKGVTLKGPAAIGSGVTIEKYAKILPFSVIGNNCAIGSGAVISETILWDNVKVAGGVHLAGCVIADNAYLKESMAFYEAAILSAHPE
ncbi:MAG: NDP-sugar synthase [Elusimicrobia bacterium]|nr:NDP-sugar synthase [Elusimicrobiota bacterium]